MSIINLMLLILKEYINFIINYYKISLKTYFIYIND
jgi:hypothetical protein